MSYPPPTPHPVMVQLRQARLDAGLTQVAVAAEIGMTRAMVSMLESGERQPVMKTACAYASAVGWQITAAPLPDLTEVPS